VANLVELALSTVIYNQTLRNHSMRGNSPSTFQASLMEGDCLPRMLEANGKGMKTSIQFLAKGEKKRSAPLPKGAAT